MERGNEGSDFEKVWRGRGRLAEFVTLLPNHAHTLEGFIFKRATHTKIRTEKPIDGTS